MNGDRTDASLNYRSGPLATAIQRVCAVPLFPVLLAFGVVANVLAWARCQMSGGLGGLARHSTFPESNPLRYVASRMRVLNVLELEERVIDPERARAVLERYTRRNGFTPGQVTMETRAIGPDTKKTEVYRELYTRDSESRIHLIVLTSPRHTMLCGLYDFGYFDGTSCFNFLKGFLAEYFDDRETYVRPARDAASELALSLAVTARFGAGYTLSVAIREAFAFARGWSRWALAREGYDLFLPPRVSLALVTIEPEDTARMVRRLEAEKVKPFEHFLRVSAAALERCGPWPDVQLVVPISCQQRYYEPRLPRDQVGYWLIGRSSRHSIGEIARPDFCARYYDTLGDELEAVDHGVRQALARQAMLGFGGTGNGANSRAVLWFNSYGVREVTPSAGPVTYHWGPNYRFCTRAMLNVISVNGVTCITLGSTTMSRGDAERCLEELRRLLLADT